MPWSRSSSCWWYVVVACAWATGGVCAMNASGWVGGSLAGGRPGGPGSRSCAVGTRGCAATSQVAATEAASRTLRLGGTAADAAVAAAAALAVTEPTSTGAGGDAFCLYYDAKERSVSCVQGGGRAPARLSLAALRAEGFEGSSVEPAHHALTCVVPGAPMVWDDVVKRHGRLALKDVLAPAVELAEGGFAVGPVTAELWRRQEGLLKAQGAAALLTKEGKAPRPGERHTNPDLGRTLRKIGEDGARKGFYSGRVAEAIVEACQSRGGVLELEDLAAHTTEFPEALSATYRGVRVWEVPPPNHGLAALLALNVLEAAVDGDALRRAGHNSPEHVHAAVEAMRFGFADTLQWCGDPLTDKLPTEELLAKEYAARRAATISPDGCVDPKPATEDELRAGPDTVYFCVVDGEGNACSFINSNYDGFGTAIVPDGCGFPLQNRGHNFILQDGHVNCVAPRKRPYHTIIPGLATDASTGDLLCAFGVMGGFMQPQGHLQVMSHMVDFGLNPQEALDAPRWCIDGVGSQKGAGCVAGAELCVEEGMPEETVEALRAKGHRVRVCSGLDRTVFGRGQVIFRDPSSGVLWGGSDARGDGCAIAF